MLATYRYAVELFAYLCQQFRLDPLADGVIISTFRGMQRGIASNHGDVEHLWSKFGLSMAQFRKDIKAAMEGSTTEDSLTAIMGKAEATAGADGILSEKEESVRAAVRSGYDPAVPFGRGGGGREGVISPLHSPASKPGTLLFRLGGHAFCRTISAALG